MEELSTVRRGLRECRRVRESCSSKAQAGIEGKYSIAGRLHDSSEVGDIHIQVWNAELWMIQDIDGIHSNLQSLVFSKAHTFEKVQVQTDFSWSLNPALTETADRSRQRILQNDSFLRIGQSELVILRLESLQRRNSCSRRVGELMQIAEVNDEIGR